MPLVVSSLTGDASDVFDWILSLNPGNNSPGSNYSPPDAERTLLWITHL